MGMEATTFLKLLLYDMSCDNHRRGYWERFNFMQIIWYTCLIGHT